MERRPPEQEKIHSAYTSTGFIPRCTQSFHVSVRTRVPSLRQAGKRAAYTNRNGHGRGNLHAPKKKKKNPHKESPSCEVEPYEITASEVLVLGGESGRREFLARGLRSPSLAVVNVHPAHRPLLRMGHGRGVGALPRLGGCVPRGPWGRFGGLVHSHPQSLPGEGQVWGPAGQLHRPSRSHHATRQLHSRSEDTGPCKRSVVSVHGGIDLGAGSWNQPARPSAEGWRGTVPHPYGGTLFSREKERSADPHCSLDEPGGHAEGQKPGPKGQVPSAVQSRSYRSPELVKLDRRRAG